MISKRRIYSLIVPIRDTGPVARILLLMIFLCCRLYFIGLIYVLLLILLEITKMNRNLSLLNRKISVKRN